MCDFSFRPTLSSSSSSSAFVAKDATPIGPGWERGISHLTFYSNMRQEEEEEEEKQFLTVN